MASRRDAPNTSTCAPLSEEPPGRGGQRLPQRRRPSVTTLSRLCHPSVTPRSPPEPRSRAVPPCPSAGAPRPAPVAPLLRPTAGGGVPAVPVKGNSARDGNAVPVAPGRVGTALRPPWERSGTFLRRGTRGERREGRPEERGGPAESPPQTVPDGGRTEPRDAPSPPLSHPLPATSGLLRALGALSTPRLPPLRAAVRLAIRTGALRCFQPGLPRCHLQAAAPPCCPTLPARSFLRLWKGASREGLNRRMRGKELLAWFSARCHHPARSWAAPPARPSALLLTCVSHVQSESLPWKRSQPHRHLSGLPTCDRRSPRMGFPTEPPPVGWEVRAGSEKFRF